MSRETSNSLTSAELSVIAHVGNGIAKLPKNYKKLLSDQFQNPAGSRRSDIAEVTRILDATLGKAGELSLAINELETATNNFCRLLGENIRRSTVKNAE